MNYISYTFNIKSMSLFASLFIFSKISSNLAASSEEEDTASNLRAEPLRNVRSASYHGQWDIGAKQAATLCGAVNFTNSDGYIIEAIPEPDKSTYLRDGKCWKFQWVPCEGEVKDDRLGSDGVLAKRRKPCGHYKMVSAPGSQC